jgi:hypothetical protein
LVDSVSIQGCEFSVYEDVASLLMGIEEKG